MSKIVVAIKGIWIYLWARIFALCVYDRKYLRGKYFSGKYHGVFALGWKWVMNDCKARILLGINRGIPFPVSPRISIIGHENIIFHSDDLNNFQGIGNYFQAFGTGKIYIGKGTWIAPNVGLITTNHNINDPLFHVESKDIVIGDKCWIGMNSVLLPGVILGPHTTVGAGSVVTKSFPEGYSVVAGNPARIIKMIEKPID